MWIVARARNASKAGRNALPAAHQAAILLLEPGKGALGLKPWHHFFDRSAAIVLRLPDPLRDLRPDPTLAQYLPQGFRIITFLRRDALEAVAGAATFPRADLDGLEQRYHLGTLIPLGLASSGSPRASRPRP